MKLVDVRNLLMARLVDGFIRPEVPVFSEEDTDIDLDRVTTNYFIKAELQWITATQVGMGSRIHRKKRQYGRLTLHLFCRSGTGDYQKTLYLDELDNLFGMQDIGGVTTDAASPGRHVEQGGWCGTPFSVPFFADIELSTIA